MYRTGDRILEYNGTDLREATAEEAAYELAKPADKVEVVAQYLIDSMYYCFKTVIDCNWKTKYVIFINYRI